MQQMRWQTSKEFDESSDIKSSSEKAQGLCRMYANSGTCSYGAACRFVHTLPKVKEVCHVYQKTGVCPSGGPPEFGGTCSWSHVNYVAPKKSNKDA